MTLFALTLALLPVFSSAETLDLSVVYEQARQIARDEAHRLNHEPAPRKTNKTKPHTCVLSGANDKGYLYRCDDGSTVVRPAETPVDNGGIPALRVVPQLIFLF